MYCDDVTLRFNASANTGDNFTTAVGFAAAGYSALNKGASLIKNANLFGDVSETINAATKTANAGMSVDQAGAPIAVNSGSGSSSVGQAGTAGSVYQNAEKIGQTSTVQAANTSALSEIPASVSVKVVPQSATGIQWGGGIQSQGLPFEDYLATSMPANARLPQNFKTFDFFDEQTGVATSAKTLDTTTAAKVADPSQVYSSLKGNVDAAANYNTAYTLSDITVKPANITSRVVEVAVPVGTTSEQWAQIQKAIDYAASKNVTLKITVTE